jgi:UDP-N-acetylglucosamine 2-epimerase (non-hydrolysing)
MTIRVLSIFGTRPEAVKMAPVVRALAQTPEIESRVCVTAQHRQMLDQVLRLFEITPDVDLDLMQPDQSLAESAAAIFTHLDPVIKRYQPDWALAQGDTTTVMAAALLAYYNRVRFGHVEAGLRTGDKYQPFPEEINRRVAGVVADLHFAPTEWSRQNLLREGVPDRAIVVTGNPVIDALQWVAQQPPTPEVLDLFNRLGIDPHPQPLSPWERGVSHPPSGEGSGVRAEPRLIVVTAHRRENFGQPLVNICAALRQLAETYGEGLRLVYPVHLNPNVQEPVYRLLGGIPNITLLPPLDYLPLVHLIKRATLVLTDSGGIQEEAPSLGAPVLVLRAVTERPEGVQAGTVRLVGTDTARIVTEARRLLDDPQAHAAMARAVNPYGDGQAAGRIVQAIMAFAI